MQPEFEYLAAPGTVASSAAGFAPDVQRELSIGQVIERMKMARGYSGSGGPARSYSQVSAVYACVRALASAHARMTLMVSTTGDQVIENGPMVQLAECPNPGMTGRKFWRTTSAHLDLHGRFHWWIKADPIGLPLEVFPINPLQMRPVIDKATGELTAWKYRAAGRFRGVEETIPADEVHTVVDPDFDDADNPLEGLSPRKAATRAISQIWKAQWANEKSLDNGVEPGGVFTMPDQPGDDQLRDFKEQVNEYHAGVMNRRRFLVMYGGMDFKPTTANFHDMEFADLLRLNRVEIASAYGVPPAILGWFEDSNRAHAEAAEVTFYHGTVLPRAAWFAEEWQEAILSRFERDRSTRMTDSRRSAATIKHRVCHGYGPGKTRAMRYDRQFFAWFDGSKIPAVQRAQLALAEQAKTWIDKGVPLNAVIRAHDLPYEEVPWGDVWHRPIGLVDVTEDAFDAIDDPAGPPPAPPEVPDVAEPGNGDDTAPSRGRPKGRRSATDAKGGHSGGVVAKAAADERRKRIWTAWRKSWSGLERAFRSKIKRHLNDLRADTLARLEASADRLTKGLSGVQQRDLVGEIVFDVFEANGSLVVKVTPLFRESMQLGGEQSIQEAAAAKGEPDPNPFSIDDPNVQAALRKRTGKITGLNRTLQKRLRAKLADKISVGASVSELSDAIKDEFNIAVNRTRTIAQTEVGAAVEEARSIGREQAGVPMKSWLWSRKESGRPTHRATEESTMAAPIPNAEDFTITGTSVTAPHPRGSGRAEHDINCGCTTVARFEGDSVKSLLDRYERHGFLTYERMVKRREARHQPKDAD